MRVGPSCNKKHCELHCDLPFWSAACLCPSAASQLHHPHPQPFTHTRMLLAPRAGLPAGVQTSLPVFSYPPPHPPTLHPTGGCFWGLELAYQRLPGVVKTSVGYTAGQTLNPTYEEVCGGRTGHTEAVQVRGWGGVRQGGVGGL